MSNKILETHSDTLQNFDKHNVLIVRDYKKYFRYRIIGILTFISGLLSLYVLYNMNRIALAVFFLFVSICISAFLFLLGSRCPICDKFFSKDKVQDGTSDNPISFCMNCKLTDEQMRKFVDMLKRGVEINEENARKIFLEK